MSYLNKFMYFFVIDLTQKIIVVGIFVEYKNFEMIGYRL